MSDDEEYEDDGKQRYWLLFVDDSVAYDEPLSSAQVMADWAHEVAAGDPGAKVEIRQCSRDDLDLAGEPWSTDGIGWDEYEDEDEDDGDGDPVVPDPLAAWS